MQQPSRVESVGFGKRNGIQLHIPKESGCLQPHGKKRNDGRQSLYDEDYSAGVPGPINARYNHTGQKKDSNVALPVAIGEKKRPYWGLSTSVVG